MSVYERYTRVDAPLSEVWAFHSRIDGLKSLTPDWVHLEIESVRGPDGETDPGVLEAETEIEASARPLGMGPRQSATVRIAEREEGDGSARFVDEMVEGPLPHWEHTHSFFADDGGTVARDRVEYRLPGGELGRLVGPAARIGFEPVFRYRHRRMKELLE